MSYFKYFKIGFQIMDYFISIGAINYFYFITCRSFFIKFLGQFFYILC